MQRLKTGTLLQNGMYKIESSLGQGSFGITYLGEHVNLGKQVAIKEFFMKDLNSRSEDGSITGMSDGSLSRNYYNKFKKESINLSHLDHPNIVRVTDSFEENGTFYYVMDYIDGQNLNDYIKRHPISESEAVEIIKSVADALIYMHEKHHMLHLDLKPGNVMRRSSDGHIFLIDFGLSKHYDNDGHPETSTTIGLGTAGYAPIEQANRAKDGEFRPTIDVYALGATFYKLLTGETPPEASMLVSEDSLIKENLRTKGISENLVKIVVESMCPNVKKRTQTIEKFKKELETAKNSEGRQTNGDDNTIIIGGNNSEENKPPKVEPEPLPPIIEKLQPTEGEKTTKVSHSIDDFEGRVGRSIFWMIFIFVWVATFLVIIIISIQPKLLEPLINNKVKVSPIGFLYFYYLYHVAFTIGAKRCHDLGHSGWFQMIPFYFFVMLLSEGSYKDNEYGSPNNGISKVDFIIMIFMLAPLLAFEYYALKNLSI